VPFLETTYKIRDVNLAESGYLKIRWAQAHMPVLSRIKKRFLKEKTLKGIRIGACLHVTKETAVLMLTLKAAGAEIYLSPSNPLSTQDDVAAALVKEGVHVFAWRGMSRDEYYQAILTVINSMPNITMDDGADLTGLIHKIYYREFHDEVRNLSYTKMKPEELIRNLKGGTEETTTGVIRLRSLEKNGKLLYPIIAVNDSQTKFMFDNRYGTGQSALDGVIRATNILLAGKNVVVAGYGWVGRGIANRARGLGARVIVVETDPIKALEAYFDGFLVTNMSEAAKIGDVFITATGNIDVIRKEHFLKMRNGVILANAGHFNVEIAVKELKEISVNKRRINAYVEEYELPNGNKVCLIAEGRLVNLAAAEGHPSEVMDMSFSNQALAVEYLVRKGRSLKPKVYKLPRRIDERIARLKLNSLGVKLEKLTEKQRKYLASWELGT